MTFLRKIWDWIVKQIYKVPFDKWLHFIAGLLVAALTVITFHFKWCIAPALFAGIAKEAFDYFTTKKVEWLDLLATVIGGLIIQIFALLG